jgi:CubicO group peptidase (beta-lactamase class C family)
MPASTPFLPSSPEAQGIRSGAILAFVDALERGVQHAHSLLLVRRGALVAEGYWQPYGPDDPHMLFSLSKSFTSTAIGMLVAEGRLSVDDPVLGFFPDEAPAAPDEHLRRLRVRHLLTMTTGHETDPTRALRAAGLPWTRAFLAEPLAREPGTHFVYNSAATYMLSAIAQRLTGERLVHYLGPRLFEPLGIADPVWETSPEGIDAGGWGLSATTADVARFGQLYLQQGMWQGRRLLPAEWVAEATARQVPNGPSANPDWEQGYGYQFWRCRHGAYRGDGAFGQFCVVMPAQEAVLALTSGVRNMQSVLDLVWEHLLPAMGPAPLPADRAAEDALAARLAGLGLPPVGGQHGSPSAAELSGRTFALAANDEGVEALGFEFADEGCALTVRTAGGQERILCGHGRWVRGEVTALRAREGEPDATRPANLAASGGWADAQTYVAQLCWYRTPFRRTLTCRFDGDRLTVDQQVNVGFGPDERPRLEGRSAPAHSVR